MIHEERERRKGRFAKHLVRRVRHALAADLIASSVNDGIVIARPFKFNGISCLSFGLSPAAAHRTADELISKISTLEQLGLGLGQRHRFIYNNGEIVVDEWFAPTRVKYSGSKEIFGKETSTEGEVSDTAPSVFPTKNSKFLALLRERLAKLPAGDVAAMLLLARGIEYLGMPLGDVLNKLKRPRSVSTILCGVDGIEDRLLDLLRRGLILPGESMITMAGENSSRGEVRQASKRGVRRHIVAVLGSLYGPESHDRAIAEAAAGVLPLLCVSEFKSGIPKTMAASADLTLTCPSLSAEIIGETIEILTGTKPSPPLPDLNFDFVGLDDLNFAIGPGVSASEAAGRLRSLIESREPTTMPKAAMTNDTIVAKSNSEIVMPAPPGQDTRTTENISGYPPSLIEWSQDLKSDLGLWKQGDLPWEDVGASLLLSGRPGTGKTIFAEVLANTLSIPLVRTSVSIWLQPSYLGPVLKRMKETFSEARSHAPAVLFVDEIDGIGTRASQDKEFSDYWNAVINNLLELLNPSSRGAGLIVIGATNRPQHIDEAIKRAGRLSPHIEIGPPDRKALAGIFRHYLASDLKDVAMTAPRSLSGSSRIGTEFRSLVANLAAGSA